MSAGCCTYGAHKRRRIAACIFISGVWITTTPALPADGTTPRRTIAPSVSLARSFVVAQIPAGTDLETEKSVSGGMLRAPYGEDGRIVIVSADRAPRVLTEGFHSACDPDVSFDGKRILFAGKRMPGDAWNIFEMDIDGSHVRQVTRDVGDCRNPGYQSALYTIVSAEPWHQITFVGSGTGALNEYGYTRSTNLYSCKADGSAVRRLTFNLSSDLDPFLLYDGRLLFAGWLRRTLDRGIRGRIGLFGVNIDGTDYAVFAANEGRRIKHMPCATTKGLVVFVEAERVLWDGAGSLSSVQIRRPLHSYRKITSEADGLFHTPSPLPDGTILVSRRPPDGTGTHAVYRLDPSSGRSKVVFDDPGYHDIQAKVVAARPEPDGRSSVVTDKDPHGKLYCLNTYITDIEDRQWMSPGTIERIRVLEGVPVKTGDPKVFLPTGPTLPGRTAGSTVHGIPPLARRRILGEVPIEKDGSFNITVPANTPIEIQVLDANGMALRSCGWIWARNHEPRGCIGCHEDPELTPENRFVDAAASPSILLCPPPEERRAVGFRRDVMPIIEMKCAPCHRGDHPLRMDGGLALLARAGGEAYFNRAYESLLAPGKSTGDENPRRKYVHPGKARTSPLVWNLFGRNTSRPWDRIAGQTRIRQMPPKGEKPLTAGERRTFVEWIDTGALWDGIAGVDHLPGSGNVAKGAGQ